MHTPPLHSFSNLGISLDATTLLSCSILIFYDTRCLGQQLSKIQLPKSTTSSKEIQCVLELTFHTEAHRYQVLLDFPLKLKTSRGIPELLGAQFGNRGFKALWLVLENSCVETQTRSQETLPLNYSGTSAGCQGLEALF